jgi:hypothetical protein
VRRPSAERIAQVLVGADSGHGYGSGSARESLVPEWTFGNDR